jgi:hypothetical protein
VEPVEFVGEYVSIVVQRKAPNGRWTAAGSGFEQVLFDAPDSWQGTFTTKLEQSGRFSGTPGSWEGSVLYGSPQTDLLGHYVDYTLTSATGRLWAQGVFESGRTYDYSGTPVSDAGTLRWYYADVLGDYDATGTASVLVIRDSYEGHVNHETVGTLTEKEDGVTYVTESSRFYVADTMWLGRPAPRPVLDRYGHMTETRVVHNDADPTLTDTTTSTWNLAPSSNVMARSGFFVWSYTPRKKGLYRLRATMPETAGHAAVASPWVALSVR